MLTRVAWFNIFVFCLSWQANCLQSKKRVSSGPKSLNVIFILADDLGYGDLGWDPFIGKGMESVQTPSLKRMARNGLTLTNFHSAAPVCSPAQASILVGLFPWRMGVDFIYSGDLKLDGSREIDKEQLPLFPNIATSFRDAGYYTAHIGKWHLGGMFPWDITNRADNNNCSSPGINQYGFEEYVAMSEGTGSDRYKTHQRMVTYKEGANYLWRNDVKLPAPSRPRILTDAQTDEAIRVMQEQTAANRPFFLNLWYDAPHSPWEQIEPYYTQLYDKFELDRTRKYASMIMNMDMNIGRILDEVEALKIAEHTLIVFTSDNGPETEAGCAGPYKGGKRLLTEGGIRVPAIVQWTGKIPAGTKSDHFGISTDLFPTFVHAAKLRMPGHIRVDGLTLLPKWLNPSADSLRGDERVILWYTHSVGIPKLAAAWAYGFKVLLNDYEGRPATKLPPPLRMFDMRTDPTESNNILPLLDPDICGLLSRTMKSLRSNDAASLNNYRVPSWGDVAEAPRLVGSTKLLSRDQSLLLLQVFNYLLIRAHLFRHDGEHEWLLYLENKPYLVDSTCFTRTSNAPTFSWSSNSIQPPEFCGEGLYLQSSKVGCRCSLNSCGSRWLNSKNKLGWTQGLIYPGAAGVVPFVHKGSIGAHVAELLSASRYQSTCDSSPVTAESMLVNPRIFHSSESEDRFRVAQLSDQRCPVVSGGSAIQKQNVLSFSIRKLREEKVASSSKFVTWAEGDLLHLDGDDRKAFRKRILLTSNFSLLDGGDEFSSRLLQSSLESYSRQCHQRVHRRGKGYYLSGNTCAQSAPALVVNHFGMPFPLRLCDESLAKLTKPTPNVPPYFDDNAMTAAINDVIHYALLASSASVNSTQERLERKHIALLDPLLPHYLISGDRLSDASQWNSLSDIIDSGLKSTWGMLGPIERRLSGKGLVRIEVVVMPLLFEDCWSIAILEGLGESAATLEPGSPANTAKTARMHFFHPLSGVNDPRIQEDIARQKQFSEHLFSAMLKSVHVSIQLLSMPSPKLPVEPLAEATIALSGTRILIFLRSILKEIQARKTQDFQERSLPLSVESFAAEGCAAFLQSYLHSVVQRGAAWKKYKLGYLNFMSGRKVGNGKLKVEDVPLPPPRDAFLF